MTIPRFPLPDGQPLSGKIVLSGKSYKHLAKVLRAKAGNRVSFYDSKGDEYLSEIEHISATKITCRISQKIKQENKPDSKIILVQGLLKRDKMDLVIEKAAELGVGRIIPLITERSEIKLSQEKINSRLEHWRKIAESATSQSRRSFIPSIDSPKLFSKAILELNSKNPNLLLSEDCREKSFSETIKNFMPFSEISVIIGPPGGFTKTEVAFAEENNLIITGLKGGILRSETAAISVLSIIQYELGNL